MVYIPKPRRPLEKIDSVIYRLNDDLIEKYDLTFMTFYIDNLDIYEGLISAVYFVTLTMCVTLAAWCFNEHISIDVYRMLECCTYKVLPVTIVCSAYLMRRLSRIRKAYSDIYDEYVKRGIDIKVAVSDLEDKTCGGYATRKILEYTKENVMHIFMCTPRLYISIFAMSTAICCGIVITCFLYLSNLLTVSARHAEIEESLVYDLLAKCNYVIDTRYQVVGTAEHFTARDKQERDATEALYKNRKSN